MSKYEIAVMPGDGIGPEVTNAALAVLKECETRFGLDVNYTSYDFSADLYRRTGRKITAADMDEIGKKDAVLFGALGLVLAAVGLYGVTAYGVEQRTSEIGVRMALGADRGSVVAMVLRGAFRQVGIGLALGIPAAIGAGYLIASRLFGVTPWDPLMLAGAALLLGLATLIAAVIPARRAASVDPVQALRSE